MRYEECYRTLFIDFHNPESLEESFSKFDAKKYFKTILRVRPSEIMLWTNDHYGDCFYETKVGHKHKGLRGDYFGELSKLAHEHGIRVCAYVNVGWHNRSAEEHPDWRQLDAAGNPIGAGKWKCVCMNSPQRDFAFAMLREITGNYAPDSVWLDILQPPVMGCYCEYCQQKFRPLFGTEIPRDPKPGSLELRRIKQFRRVTRRDFIAEARETVHAIKPDVVMIWNGGGDPNETDSESDALVDKLSLERQEWAGRWMRNLGKPFEVLIKRGCYHWSDWTLAPLDVHKASAAMILASGGMVNMGDAGVPDGTLQEPVYDQLSEVFGFIERLEPFIKGARSAPNIAVLHSIKSNHMAEWTTLSGDFPGRPPRRSGLASLRGVCQMLSETHRHFDIIPEEKLEQLGQYRLLILPDQINLSESEAGLIRGYVRQGGRVMATFRTGMYDAEGREQEESVLADVFGVSLHGKQPFSVGYIEPEAEVAKGLPGIPILVDATGGMLQILPEGPFWGGRYARCESARRLARMIDPRLERSEKEWVSHGQAHPFKRTEYAAASVNAFGSGQAMYVPYPIFRAYFQSGYPALGRFLENLLSLICPSEMVKVNCEGPLEVVLNQRRGEYLLHLISGKPLREGIPWANETPLRPSYDVRVEIDAPNVKRVALPLRGGKEISFKRINGQVVFTLPKVDVHELVVIEQADEASA